MWVKSWGQNPLLTCALFLGLLTCTISSNPNVRFSKLLNEKSEFLRFTSIANTADQESPRFQNIYNRADDLQAASVPDYDNEFPSARLITEPNEEDTFVRIRQELNSAPPTRVEHAEDSETLTRINQKPISGRTHVTALRQSTGKRLNISPVFLSEDQHGGANQDIHQPGNGEGVAKSPEDDEEIEVTTVQNYELEKDEYHHEFTTEKPIQPVTTPATSTGNNFTEITTANPRIGITVFDNRSNPDPIYSTTPVSIDLEEKENFLAESFHRSGGGNFPDFEDLPTNLAGAESSQPARVNVRPAASGKNYEYEYIYYYYDDDDEDNTTTVKPPITTGSSGADLSSHRVEPNNFQNHKPAIEPPSNFLESQRNQKSVPPPEVLSIQNPSITAGLTPVLGSNRPIVIKQSNMIPQNSEEQNYPQVPRANHNLPAYTTLPPETTTHARQYNDIQNKFKNQPPAANHFEPPVLQFQFVEKPAVALPPPSAAAAPPPSAVTATAPQRSRNPIHRNQFQSQREPEHVQQVHEEQEAPVPRRTPSRRPQPNSVARPESEVQQQHQVSPSIQHTVPAQLIDGGDTLRLPGPRTRQSTPIPLQGQFQPPLIPSRGVASDPIIEVQPPVLETTPAAVQNPIPADDRQARENFARQKSVNDLYALSRLHQLAINTKIPDKKSPETGPSGGSRGTPPRISAGFIRTPEITTAYPADHMEVSESTTISSFAPSGGFLTTADVQRIPYATTEESPLVSPTNQVILNSSPPANHERSTFKDRANGRFRGKARTTTSASTTTSTSTEAAPRAYQHNRFAGRRRNFPQPGTSTTEDTSEASPSSGPFQIPIPTGSDSDTQSRPPPPSRSPLPGRNRFTARTRPTTSTTEAPSSAPVVEHVENSPRIPNRRPVANRPVGGALNQRRRFSTSTQAPADSHSSAETHEEPLPALATTPVHEEASSRRSIGRVRQHRPPGNGIGPILGRPLRGGRTSTTTTTTTTTEHPEASYVTADEPAEPSRADTHGETIGTTVLDVNEPVPTSQIQEASAGVITQKISVSSSTTTSESAEPPKRGSAGVLGRLRSRSKALGSHSISTTSSPDVVQSTTERKASRVGGILNRRKSTTTSTTSSSINIDDRPEVDTAHGHELPEGIPPNGVIVQVSSVVSESEEDSGSNHRLAEDSNSSSPPPPQGPQGSILNRLKSHRKPGSLFRRREPEQPHL